ncbi:MAG: hypothetical protein AAGF11_56725, partial [Myxococcota bacterium]
VEAQLNPHASKSFTWPLYVVVVRHRLRCRTTLVVLTDSDSVARWARRPIDIGHGMVMHPVVIGPRQIPRDLSLEVARRVPALAVLAVVAHGRGPDAERVGRMAFEVTQPMVARGDERAMLYLDVIFDYLDEDILATILEESMDILPEPISDFFMRHRIAGRHEGHREGHREGRRKGRREGRAEGMTRMLRRLLNRRKLEPTAEQRQRLATCTDPQQLQQWFDRAVTATSVGEIFDG